MTEALQRIRNQTRTAERRPGSLVASWPLLVKGLEYDHVIDLNPATYGAQKLYAALTRG